MGFVLFVSQVTAAPVVVKAFEHPSGFIVFEVLSDGQLRQRQELQDRAVAGERLLLWTEGARWYFGRRGQKTVRQLAPLPALSALAPNELDINFNFGTSDKDGNPDDGYIKGKLSRDPQDVTADLEGQVQVTTSAGEVVFAYSSSLANELTSRLQRNELQLQVPPQTVRVPQMRLKDSDGNLYIMDHELLVEARLGPDAKAQREDLASRTREFLRISPTGQVDFYNIVRYRRPVEEALARRDGSARSALGREVELDSGKKLIEASIEQGGAVSLVEASGKVIPLHGAYADAAADALLRGALPGRYRSGVIDPCAIVLAETGS